MVNYVTMLDSRFPRLDSWQPFRSKYEEYTTRPLIWAHQPNNMHEQCAFSLALLCVALLVDSPGLQDVCRLPCTCFKGIPNMVDGSATESQPKVTESHRNLKVQYGRCERRVNRK